MVFEKHDRKTIRIPGYDYSAGGYYYITICVKRRICLFGIIDNASMNLSKIGEIANQCWIDIPVHYKNVKLDEYVIMPDHIHGIIIIEPTVGVEYIQPLQCKPNENRYQHIIPSSICSIVREYKSAVTRLTNRNGHIYFKWQRNYYDHVIRNDDDLNRIREYIENNPANWLQDELFA